MRTAFAFIFVLALLTTTTAAQTTQPAATLWKPVMEHLGQRLANSSASDDGLNVLEDVSLRAFGSREMVELHQLSDRLAGTVLIGTYAYPSLPRTLAGDLSADINRSDLPESIKHSTAIQDPADEPRANATAARWLAQTLTPSNRDAIGVIVFYEAGKADLERTDPGHLLFVLLKGQSSGRKIAITHLVFGDPIAGF